MRRETDYQDLLKAAAIILVIIDHLGLYGFIDYHISRVPGRLAMPVFCFFAGYNFKKIIRFKILINGVMLYLISTYFIFNSFTVPNILISIFLGHVYIYLSGSQLETVQKIRSEIEIRSSKINYPDYQTKINNYFRQLTNRMLPYFHVFLLIILFPLTYKYFEYGTLAIAIMVLGYMAKFNQAKFSCQKILIAVMVAAISLMHTTIMFSGLFNYVDIIISIVLAVLLCFALVICNYQANINLPLIGLLSGNTMLIYCVHLLIIQFIAANS